MMVSSPHLDDAHGEPVPRLDRLGRSPLADTDRLAATQKVAGQKGLARLNVADLIEAHRRRSERGHVGSVHGRLFPAAPFEVVIDDVAGALDLSGEEILERASPEGRDPVITDKLAELLEVRDVGMSDSAANVLLDDVREGFPPWVAGEPLHQTGERMG